MKASDRQKELLRALKIDRFALDRVLHLGGTVQGAIEWHMKEGAQRLRNEIRCEQDPAKKIMLGQSLRIVEREMARAQKGELER